MTAPDAGMTTGYYVEFERGFWQKKGEEKSTHTKGPAVYHGSVTKEQAVELERIVHKFLDDALAPKPELSALTAAEEVPEPREPGHYSKCRALIPVSKSFSRARCDCQRIAEMDTYAAALRARLAEVKAERDRLALEVDQCHAKSTCCCGEYMKGHTYENGHSSVSMYDYALLKTEERLHAAERERDEARAEIELLHVALRAALARLTVPEDVRDGRTQLHAAWSFAKENPTRHADGYRKDAFAYVLWWLHERSADVALPSPAPSGQDALEKLRPLVAEIWTAHRDPMSPDYNQCDESACEWCAQTRAALGRTEPGTKELS